MSALGPDSQPRLLVFDWDGTLMDSLGSIVACTQLSLRELGLPPRADHEIRHYIGMGLKETFDHLYPETSDEERLQVVERYRQHWLGTFREHPVLLPGVAAALDALIQQDFWLAIATGKSRLGLERDLDATGLRSHFLATRTVSESPSKPHPQMLLDVMGELGVRPQETLMIGDTTYDLQMAQEAGSAGLGVLSGSHSREMLLSWNPLACLDSVEQLPPWLASRA